MSGHIFFGRYKVSMNKRPNLQSKTEAPDWHFLKNELRFTEKACPVCHSQVGTLKHERLISGHHMKFWICHSCNALYTKNPLTNSSSRELFNSKNFYASNEPGNEQGHNNVDYYDFLGGEKYLRMTARNRLLRIKKHHPSGKMLEVASAAGFFLIEAKNAGYEVEGVEISKPIAKWSAERWGVPVCNESVETISLPTNHYDVIATWGVMTLLQDPATMVKKYYDALKPGGIWTFNTYYHDSLWHKIFGPRWIALAVQTRQIFSNQLLIDIIEKEGFQLKSRRRDWPYTDLLKICDQLAWNTGAQWLVPAIKKTGMENIIIKVPLPDVYEYTWEKPVL